MTYLALAGTSYVIMTLIHASHIMTNAYRKMLSASVNH